MTVIVTSFQILRKFFYPRQCFFSFWCYKIKSAIVCKCPAREMSLATTGVRPKTERIRFFLLIMLFPVAIEGLKNRVKTITCSENSYVAK